MGRLRATIDADGGVHCGHCRADSTIRVDEFEDRFKAPEGWSLRPGSDVWWLPPHARRRWEKGLEPRRRHARRFGAEGVLLEADGEPGIVHGG